MAIKTSKSFRITLRIIFYGVICTQLYIWYGPRFKLPGAGENSKYWYRYNRDRDKIILGSRRDYDYDDRLRRITPYRFGKVHGTVVEFGESGDTLLVNHYIKGELHGINYRCGLTGMYVNGKREGVHYRGTSEHRRGESSFVNDTLHGKTVRWRSDGSVEVNSYYDKELKTESHFFFSQTGDTLKIESYKDGLKHGLVRDHNGKISHWMNGVLHGEYRGQKHHTLGILSGNYILGLRHGLWYYENEESEKKRVSTYHFGYEISHRYNKEWLQRDSLLTAIGEKYVEFTNAITLQVVTRNNDIVLSANILNNENEIIGHYSVDSYDHRYDSYKNHRVESVLDGNSFTILNRHGRTIFQNCKDGLKSGTEIAFNGNVLGVGEYKNDVREGHFREFTQLGIWSDDSLIDTVQLSRSVHYRNGLKEGDFYLFYRAGLMCGVGTYHQSIVHGTYDNDMRVGTWVDSSETLCGSMGVVINSQGFYEDVMDPVNRSVQTGEYRNDSLILGDTIIVYNSTLSLDELP